MVRRIILPVALAIGVFTLTLQADDSECLRNFKERGAMLIGQRWSTTITLPNAAAATVRVAIVEHLKSGEWLISVADDTRIEAQERVSRDNPSRFAAVITAADEGLAVELSFKNAPMISVDDKQVKDFLCAVAETATLAATPANKAVEPELDLVVQDILAHQKVMFYAALQHNTTLLDKHIADDAILFYDGKPHTKTMYLAAVMEAPIVAAQVKSTYSNIASRTVGDAIEVTATSIVSRQAQGRWKDIYEWRGTFKCKKVNNDWILLASTELYSKALVK